MVALFLQHLPGGLGLLDAVRGQRDVFPARETVLFVPDGFAVAQHDQFVHFSGEGLESIRLHCIIRYLDENIKSKLKRSEDFGHTGAFLGGREVLDFGAALARDVVHEGDEVAVEEDFLFLLAELLDDLVNVVSEVEFLVVEVFEKFQ